MKKRKLRNRLFSLLMAFVLSVCCSIQIMPSVHAETADNSTNNNIEAVSNAFYTYTPFGNDYEVSLSSDFRWALSNSNSYTGQDAEGKTITWNTGDPLPNPDPNGKYNGTPVVSMEGMFRYCSSLTNLDLSSFDTSNVTNMYEMFFGCDSLTNLDLSSFDTSNVTNMSGMFDFCKSLTNLDLSSFDTSNVTNMYQMFYRCDSLTNLDLSNFDTSNVTDMVGMFSGCYSLTNLDLSSFDTSKLLSLDGIFDGTSSNIENKPATCYAKDQASADMLNKYADQNNLHVVYDQDHNSEVKDFPYIKFQDTTLTLSDKGDTDYHISTDVLLTNSWTDQKISDLLKSLTWTSDNEEVSTYNDVSVSNGHVELKLNVKATGKATITGKNSQGFTVTANVTVEKKSDNIPQIIPTEVSLGIGELYRIPFNGIKFDEIQQAKLNGDRSAIRIFTDADKDAYVIYGVKEGTANISLKTNNSTISTCTVTVTKHVNTDGYSKVTDGWPIVNCNTSFDIENNYRYPLRLIGEAYGYNVSPLIDNISLIKWGGACFGMSLLSVAQYDGLLGNQLQSMFEKKGNNLNEYGYEKIYTDDNGQEDYALKKNSEAFNALMRAQISCVSAELKPARVFRTDHENGKYFTKLIDYLNGENAKPLLLTDEHLHHAMVIETSQKPIVFSDQDGHTNAIIPLYDPNTPYENGLQNPSDCNNQISFLQVNEDTGEYWICNLGNNDGKLESYFREQGNYSIFGTTMKFFDVSKLNNAFFKEKLKILTGKSLFLLTGTDTVSVFGLNGVLLLTVNHGIITYINNELATAENITEDVGEENTQNKLFINFDDSVDGVVIQGDSTQSYALCDDQLFAARTNGDSNIRIDFTSSGLGADSKGDVFCQLALQSGLDKNTGKTTLVESNINNSNINIDGSNVNQIKLNSDSANTSATINVEDAEGNITKCENTKISDVEYINPSNSKVVLKEAQKANSATLNKESLSLGKDENEKLNITALNPEGASTKGIMWESSDKKVATVDDQGKVKAVGNGSAVISLKNPDGKVLATCNVTVSGYEHKDEDKPEVIAVSDLLLDMENMDLTVGDTKAITATVKPDNAFDKKINWLSSDTTVAVVDDYGMVKAVAPGTAVITAKAGSKTASCNVTVIENKSEKVLATSATLNKKSIALGKDGSVILQPTALEPEGASTDGFRWISSDEKIASVDANGSVKATGNGEATISLLNSEGKVLAACKVTVSGYKKSDGTEKVSPKDKNSNSEKAATSVSKETTETVTKTNQKENTKAIVRTDKKAGTASTVQTKKKGNTGVDAKNGEKGGTESVTPSENEENSNVEVTENNKDTDPETVSENKNNKETENDDKKAVVTSAKDYTALYAALAAIAAAAVILFIIFMKKRKS